MKDNKNNLTYKLGEIDGKFLDELTSRRARRMMRRKNIMKLSGIAASLVIVVAISVAIILPLSQKEPINVLLETKETVTSGPSETQVGLQTEDTFSQEDNYEKPNDTFTADLEAEFGPENFNRYYVSITADYVATDLKDIARMADLVICVRYEKNIDTYVSSGKLPVTRAEFLTLEVLKGEYAGDKIIAEYYGGTVTMYEYLQSMSESEKLKGGYDYTDEEAKNIFVTYLNENNGVSFETGGEYLLCLGYDENDGTYMILSDSFGMSEITDGQVYNKAKNEYIKLSEIFD